MIITDTLNEAVGIEKDPIREQETDFPALSYINNAIVVGYFRRGRLDKPFKVSNDNFRGLLGSDAHNPSFQIVESLFDRGVAEVWIMRVIKPKAMLIKYNGEVQANGEYRFLDARNTPY